MKKWIGLLIAILIIAAASGALAVGPVSIDMPGEIWCNDNEPVFTFYCPGASQIYFYYYENSSGVSGWVQLDSSGNGTYTGYSPEKGGSGKIELVTIYDKDDNSINDNTVFPFTIKTNGPLPAAKINVPSKIEIGQDLVLTMPADDSAIEYRPNMNARDSNNSFYLNYDDPLWKAGKTYTIPGEKTNKEDIYTLKFTAFKKRYDATVTSFQIIAGDPVLELAEIMMDFTDQTEALKLLNKYGIITLKDPNATYAGDSDITKKPRALRFSYFSPIYDVLIISQMTGENIGYVILNQKTAEDINKLGNGKLTKILPGDTVSLYSMKYTLKDLCNTLGIATPAVSPDSTPTSSPDSGNPDSLKDEVTVSGGVYKLNHSKLTAVFTGPAKKTATKLTIKDTVKENGKTYKVTEIKAKACKGMKKLTTVTIGKNVTKIGKSAFEKCAKLKKITIKNAKMKKAGFGSNCFKGINAKAAFKVPKKVLKNYTTWITKQGKAPKTVKIKK